MAGFAGVTAAFQLPRTPHFLAAPRAISHEWHQRTSAALVVAARRIAFIGVGPTAFFDKSGTIAPRAIIPVVLDPALASRTARGHARLGSPRRVIESAPWTKLHALGYRALAATAVVPRFKFFFEVPLKFPPLKSPPRRTASCAICRPRALLFACVALCFDEGGMHLHRVVIPALGIQLNRLLQYIDDLGSHTSRQPVLARKRPLERPLRQAPGQQAIHDQTERENVRLKFGPSHRLLRRNVVDGSGSGGFQRAQVEFRKAEVGEFQAIVRKQDVVFGFDVAVNDLVGVGMRHRCQCLCREVERACRRNPSFDPIRERFLAELHRDDKLVVDVAGVHHSQNIRVPELGRNLHLVQELFVSAAVIRLRDFQCDLDLLDRVVGAIDIGQRASRQSFQYSVLADPLTCS